MLSKIKINKKMQGFFGYLWGKVQKPFFSGEKKGFCTLIFNAFNWIGLFIN